MPSKRKPIPLYIKVVAGILQSLVIFSFVVYVPEIYSYMTDALPLWEQIAAALFAGLILSTTLTVTIWVIMS